MVGKVKKSRTFYAFGGWILLSGSIAAVFSESIRWQLLDDGNVIENPFFPAWGSGSSEWR